MAKILAGYDGSAEARRAARKAAELAANLGATLVVVRVVPPPRVPGDLPALPVPELTERQLREAELEVGEVLRELAATGAPLQSAIPRGSPAQELLRMAERDPQVDLVVVGRGGKGAIARALMGSVSSRLAHTCTRPVLIVP